MIRDLNDHAGAAKELQTDVLVIGAGTAGLLAATRLARAGIRVVVAESGGLTQSKETHPLNEVEQTGDLYGGAEHGRFRCLGGTSTRWGGAMLPFQPTDLTSTHFGSDSAWPIQPKEFDPYMREVESLFSLGHGPYDFPEIMPGQFLARKAKWPDFAKRNVATLLEREINSQAGPEIWLNATCTEFVFAPCGRLQDVTMRSQNGGRLTVRARELILAAGAIECTRLLLLADRQHDGAIFMPDGVIGKYFGDHISFPIGCLIDANATSLNEIIGFSFDNSVMRNVRFEPSAALRTIQQLPAGFLHIVPSTTNITAFDLLRDIYRTVQKRGRPSLRTLLSLTHKGTWLARAAWWRFIKKRLLFPDNSIFEVHTVCEQEPRATNQIGLSSQTVDQFGTPLARINWSVSERDVQTIEALFGHFRSTWGESSFARLGNMQPQPIDDTKRGISESGGIYHPVGSVRMGTDAARGVVNQDLRTFRVSNISVLSTATFPTAGGANPTMTLMMAALRMADQIVAQLK